MEKDIIRTIKYFHLFSYSPTFNEIYIFLSSKTNKKILKEHINKLIFDKVITLRKGKYTGGEYNKGKLEIRISKFETSLKKLNNWRFRAYIKLISLFPQIKLVGLSGSISMMNAKEDDDFDLFIITAKSRIFTSRLIALVLAQSLGLRRSRDSESLFSHGDYKNKVCLNLFFDETKLNIPNFKKNYYIAHEIIQMKPLINKNNTHEIFLYSNRWVCDIFPNSRPQRHPGTNVVSDRIYGRMLGMKLASATFDVASDFIELISKKFQLSIINRHKTKELITNKQLWFFPEDFENKLPKFARKKHNA